MSKKNNKDIRTGLWIVIGILFVVALFLTFKAGAVSTSEVAASTSSAVKSAASSGGMVGGC